MNDALWELLEKAKTDAGLRKKLWASRKAEDPSSALCEVSTEFGCPVEVGQLFEDGQSYLSALSKGCIGATEPREEWGDEYGLFFASLEVMDKE